MGRPQTPIDETSGLPLLFEPQEQALAIHWGYERAHDTNGRVVADWNHVWHPGREVVSAGSGGDGLRNSRVQFVLRSDHDDYHHYFDGPPLPAKPSGRFRAMVMCAAGYIPTDALRFETDSPRIVRLNEWQRLRLRESGEVRVASLSVVQGVMKDFVMRQSVDHVKPRTIDRFLKLDPGESTDAAREHAYLAHLLLSLAIDRIEDPLVKPYTEAHEKGLLAPDMPPRPDQFILGNILRSRKNVRGVANEFATRLARQRQGREATISAGQLALSAAV
jgi:hypothetical protein